MSSLWDALERGASRLGHEVWDVGERGARGVERTVDAAVSEVRDAYRAGAGLTSDVVRNTKQGVLRVMNTARSTVDRAARPVTKAVAEAYSAVASGW